MLRSIKIATILSTLGYNSVAAVDTIWSSVVLTRYGDRTPLISPNVDILTPLGAQQLYTVGSFFRERYVAPPSNKIHGTTGIAGISPYEIDSNQIFIMSAVDEFVVASAQAFMQGLYPPLNASSNTPQYNNLSILANGTNVDYPLGGYQYAQIYTTSPLDPNSIWLAGQVNCPAYDNSGEDYLNSPEFSSIESATKDFYAGFESSIFNGEIPNSTVTYHNAYYLFDYLTYGYTHNETVKNHLSNADLFQARTLADQWVYSVNGNVSASGNTVGDHIRTIAGQTVAAEILGLLFNNIETNGEQSKLSLLFASFEAMVSFAALAGLPNADSDFYGLPDYGSSMVFEMYSINANSSATYPDPTELFVRFLFRNGTNSTSNLSAHPLFGRPENLIESSMDRFATDMENIMLASIGDWCTICNSNSVFCPSYINNTSSNSTSSGNHGVVNSGHTGVKPVIAGVIGAIVALVVAGLLFGLVMLIGGVRLHRTKVQRRSELGGFKGGVKLASDQDLTLGKGASGATVVKGHERVGSWELGEGSKAKEANFGSLHRPESVKRPSFDSDDASIHREPTKIDEHV